MINKQLKQFNKIWFITNVEIFKAIDQIRFPVYFN